MAETKKNSTTVVLLYVYTSRPLQQYQYVPKETVRHQASCEELYSLRTYIPYDFSSRCRTKSIAKKSPTGSLPPAVPLAIKRTFRPWTPTSDDSYIYQLSLVVATATVSSQTLLLCVRSLHRHPSSKHTQTQSPFHVS